MLTEPLHWGYLRIFPAVSAFGIPFLFKHSGSVCVEQSDAGRPFVCAAVCFWGKPKAWLVVLMDWELRFLCADRTRCRLIKRVCVCLGGDAPRQSCTLVETAAILLISPSVLMSREVLLCFALFPHHSRWWEEWASILLWRRRRARITGNALGGSSALCFCQQKTFWHRKSKNVEGELWFVFS